MTDRLTILKQQYETAGKILQETKEYYYRQVCSSRPKQLPELGAHIAGLELINTYIEHIEKARHMLFDEIAKEEKRLSEGLRIEQR